MLRVLRKMLVLTRLGYVYRFSFPGEILKRGNLNIFKFTKLKIKGNLPVF